MIRKLLHLTMLLWYYTAFPQQPFHDTQGKLEISNAGQTTYTLPIALPPSLKNTGPLINIVYQSGQFGGIAGQGWNIQGISAIRRVPSRIDLDGQRQGIRFTNDDKLALNDQRLLVVSGQYWHIGSTYQTEIQSNFKVELQRNGNGIYFIVTNPDGSRSWYGNYTESQATDLAAFYICRYEDPSGNYVTYHYNKPFNKNLCLYEIRFSAHTNDLAPLNSIRFYYKHAQRTESAYNKGTKQEKAALLETIQVWSGGQLFRKYVFTHITDPQLGYEKISQIQEFNGAMEPANPVRFEYENTETVGPGSELLTTYHNNLNFDSIVLSGDFDGDGRLDFTTENQIFTNNFIGTTGQTPVNSPIVFHKQDTFTATTLAVNKLNPFQSIVKFTEGEGFKVYNLQNGNLTLSYTKRFDFPTHLPCFNPSQSCTSAKNAFLEGDFNGDGISEVLLYKICRVSGRQRFTEYECGQFCWVDLNPNISSLLTGNSLSTGLTPGVAILPNPDLLIGKKRYVGDFNGDGKSDLFIVNPNGTYKVVGFKQLSTAPWIEPELLGKGTLSTYSETKQILFGDFNGDGKTDILLPNANGTYPGNSLWHVCFSSPKPAGGSFFEVETYNIVDYWHDSGNHFRDGRQYSSYYVLDTNGDGKSDLVRIWRNQYAPKWTINDHDTNWKITSYVNTIGLQNRNGFIQDYVTPCQNYDNSCDHHSDSPDMVIPIVSTYRRGINKEILMVRNHYNQVTYVNFTKDLAKDNLLKKVTVANGALVYKINYQSLEPSDNNSGYGNPDAFYSSSNSVRYPNMEIKRLPFSWVVSRLNQTTGEVTRHQDFRYHGYTVNMHGLGALGFIKSARSSWYQNPSDTKIWNITQNDPSKRGLLINTYSQLQRPGATFSFSTGVSIPENVISSMVNEYAITTNNKVYTPLLTRQTTTDYLTSVKTVTDYLYQPVYYLPEIIRTQNFLGTTLQGETTLETEYQSNPNGVGSDYYIGRPIKTTETASAYNDRHQSETLYTYHSNGTQQKTQKKPVVESYYITTEFEYDDYGNVTQETLSAPDASPTVAPRVSAYTYDPSGRFVIASKAITGRRTQYTYHPLYGTVLTQTNPDQLTTTTRYDNWGKPVQVTDYLGKSTYYTYTKNQQTYISQQLDADGGSTISQSNVLGQQLKKGIKLSDGQWSYTATQYDFLGRKIKESDPFADTPSLWISYTYDDYGRLVETTLPTGKAIRVSYNGLTLTTNDGNKTSSTTQNANGHTISSTDNGGTVTYKYNAGGAVTESDFHGTKITTQYDNWGRKSRLSDPSAGEYRYTYYPFGEVRTTTTPLGIVKNFIDDFGRITLTEEEPKNGTSFYSRYYYNTDHTLNSTIREEYTNGKVTDEIQYEYDDYKRLKKLTQLTPHATFIKELTYDAFGRIHKEKQTAIENTSGKNSSKTFRYGYRFGYRYQISDDSNGQVLWTEHTLNSRDQLTRGTFGNGLQLGNQYDEYGYLLKADTFHPNRNTSAGRTMLNQTTQFDIQTGNLTARKNNLLNHSATFQYDNQDRLVQWKNQTITLHSDDFRSGTGEFGTQFGAIPTNENGQLKVTATQGYAGVKKTLLTQAKVGDRLVLKVKVDKGTTNKVRVLVVEYDPDSGLGHESFKGYAQNGVLEFEHTVTQYPYITLNIDKDGMGNDVGTTTFFYIDDLWAGKQLIEEQHYDDRGRITENILGQYNYTDVNKVYQNTSIDLNIADASYYQNREGIFNDGMEEQKGWSDLGLGWDIFGKPTYDDSKVKSGKYSLKIHNPTDSELTLHSDHWIPIDNPHGASYTFSGWVYSDGPSSQIFLFMNSETETGYYTLVADKYTEVTHQWVYLERTVYVPAHIKKLNIRVDNNGGGNVWFDDIRIRKTENPKTDLRQLDVTYDMFKKPVTITETGVEKVAFSYTSDHFRNVLYYGGLEDPEQQPFRKDYAADGAVEITTNQQTGTSTFVFFVGGDAYTAPVVFKDNGTTSEYLYLHRDHQGSIVAISNQHGNFVEKRLFDPWGKLLQVQDEQNHNLAGLTLLDRGYTGHEHIQGIGIINMNGRIYDPKLHRFLSPDNYIQDPYNTQNYNRYGYCLNNPLKYTDESGELFGIDDLIAGTIGGIINLTVNIVEGNIDGNFWEVVGKGSAAFGSGFAAGALATYGPAGWAAGGAIIGSTNAWLSGSDPVQGAIMGGVTGLIGGTIGQYIGKGLTVMIGSANISSPVLNGFLGGGFGGGTTGAILNFSISLASGSSFDDALKQSGNGFVSGFITGSVAGAGGAYANARVQGLNAWTGETLAAKGSSTFFQGAKYSPKVMQQMSKVDDIYHAFPKSVDGFATKFGQWSTKIGADGKTYQWLKMLGSYDGKTGTFEYIKDVNGIINHRFFNAPKVP